MESMQGMTPHARPGARHQGHDEGHADGEASERLDSLLDDSILKHVGNRYARYFWYGIAAAIAVAAVYRGLLWLNRSVRKRRAAKTHVSITTSRWLIPSKCVRAITYSQFTPPAHSTWIRIPPVGTSVMLLAYLAFVLVLEFVNDIPGYQFWQARGIRAGWLAVAQMPLVIVMVGKLNWITLLTRVSYERLNILHRWASYVMMLMAIFHFAFQAHAWHKAGVFTLQWTTDECVPTGLAAFVLLAWINVSSWRPIRNLCYELFVVQHILTYFGFIIAIMFHLPDTALRSRIYIYVPIGLYLLDRIVRLVMYSCQNLPMGRATLTKLPGDIVKVEVRCDRINSWKPGSHVLISLPTVSFGQSHPATIASSPHSHGSDIMLLLKGHRGFTKTLLAYAEEPEGSKDEDRSHTSQTHRVLIDGPYGGLHADFATFGSVCLIAGSTGITFVLSVLHGLVRTVTDSKSNLPLRHIRVIWAVKDAELLEWVAMDIVNTLQALREHGVEVVVNFFVTGSVTPGKTVLQSSPSVTPELPNGATRCQGTAYPDLDPDTTEKTLGHLGLENDGIRPAVHTGRPNLSKVVEDIVEPANGDCGVAVCGPLSMSVDVRNTVACLAMKNTKQSAYLHVEGFAF